VGGCLAAWLIFVSQPPRSASPAARQPGLVIESDDLDQAHLDPKAQLRCFVAGKFVGQATLADCAEQNGVVTGALDVGADPSGALAAADKAGANLTPLPPSKGSGVTTTESPSQTAACWHYAGNEWSRLPGETSLNACVQTLFSGRCEHPGGATYGRWGSQTLRLVPGRIEISSDDHSFKMFSDQSPGCATQ
jgi:hypothetical protein